MARTFTENYDSSTDGTTVSTSTTTYGQVGIGGTATLTHSSTRSRTGLSMKATGSTAGDNAVGRDIFSAGLVSNRWRRFYFLSSTIGTSDLIICGAFSTNATTRARLKLNIAGTFTIQNGVTAVGTSTTVLSADTWCRLEWELNGGAGTQTLRIFVGANVEGTTPDETVGPFTFNAGTFDRQMDGMVVAPTAAKTIYIDNVAGDDATWLGPVGGTTGSPQVGLPATDIGVQSWVGVPDTANLYNNIDDATRDDTNYNETIASPSSLLGVWEFKRSDGAELGDPGAGNRSGTLSIVLSTAHSPASSTFLVQLIQSGNPTPIKTWTHSSVAASPDPPTAGTGTLFTDTWSDAEGALIDWTKRLQLAVYVTVGG